MISLLKIEWLKVKNYTAFWVLFILYLVAIFGVNIIAWSINDQVRQSGAGSIVPSLYSYPTTWNMVSYVSTFLFLFPGLIIINHTGNEFSFKTSRQNIIDGWQRKDFITVKLVFAVVISLVATTMVFLTGLLLGNMASAGSSASIFDKIYYLLYFFLQTLLYCIVAVFIVLWVRKSGLAIGIYFAYSLVLENLLSGLVFWVLRNSGNTRISNLFPLQSSDSLIRTPKLSEILPGQNFSDTVMIAVVCFYIGLFCWLSYRNFMKRDL
jgi:ABC-2 type transport system permease protein